MNRLEANTVRPSTWAELQEALYGDTWDAGLNRFRSSYAYRGVARAYDGLPTSLIRLGGDTASIEKHLLRNFMKYAHRNVVERYSIWYWLSVAAHHGLPTRLLDWSLSPLVALHFATEKLDAMEEDGVVWCVQVPGVHAEVPDPLHQLLAREGAYLFTVDMLSGMHRAVPAPAATGADSRACETERPPGWVPDQPIESLGVFDGLRGEPFAVFFEPPSLDDRIVNQFALFSVLSNPRVGMDSWLADRPRLVRRIVVPAALKWEARDKLDQANITERVLLPGLDGLSKWLTRHYTPRPAPTGPRRAGGG
jgi:hypothetical protein